MESITYFNPDRRLYSEKRYSSTCVHKLDYHFVVTTKYRTPVLVGAIGTFVRDIIVEKCARLETWLLGLAVQPDHIHILIGLKPTHCAADIIGEIKGASSFLTFKRFPELAEQIGATKLWAGGYFVSTVGKTNTAQTVAYLQRQHEHHELPSND